MPKPMSENASEGGQSIWSAVDELFENAIIPHDEALGRVFATNADAGLPEIDVSPTQGKLLHIFCKMIGAKNVLEVGTLGGYSTIWLARALPEDGQVVTLEANPDYAAVAATNIAAAGCREQVDIRVGDAHDSFPKLIEDGAQFDLVFIDADKESNPEYFRWSLELTRPGSVIVVDNVVRHGAIIENPDEPSARGSLELHKLIGETPTVDATAIQTVGIKGWDGLTIARVNSAP